MYHRGIEMSIYLVDLTSDLSIELRVSEAVQRALVVQWERLKDRSVREAFCRRMSANLETVIPDSLDWDIKEPTPAQLAYAIVLAKQLKVPIPAEARLYRSKMHEFIDEQSKRIKPRGI